jgi:membrane protease YdiL (CAAX protease family)
MTHQPSLQRRGQAFVDLILVIGSLVCVKAFLLRYDDLWTYAGPVSLLVAVAVATLCLRWRSQGWPLIGLGRPVGLWRLALWTLLALVLTIVVGEVARALTPMAFGAADPTTQAIDARYQGRFDAVAGSLPDYLFWLSIAWIVGAFAEEMLFRGMLVSRFEALFSGVPYAAVVGVVLQAVLFGQQHFYYQGLAGWVATGAIGLVSGLLYLAFGRTLWPLVLAHGLSNSIGLTLLYLGLAG